MDGKADRALAAAPIHAVLCGFLILSVAVGCSALGNRERGHAVAGTAAEPFRADEAPAAAVAPGGKENAAVPSGLLPASEHPLTLADCLRLAFARHPRSRSTWEAARAAAAGLEEARADYFPSVDMRAQVSRGKTVSLDKEEENRTRDVYAAGIDVGYLLFDGGARPARVHAAEGALFEAGFRHNTNLQDIALAVESAYYELLGSQWLLKVADDTLKRTGHQLELARAQHDSGVVTRADVLRGETQHADAQLQHVQARNAVRISHGRLACAMGVPVHSTFQVAELPDHIQQQELPRIELLLDEAGRQRPDLQAALARIESSRARLAEGQAASWPILSAEANAGRRDTMFVPERDEWSVGLTLFFPLFDGFERRFRVQRARADLGRAIADYADRLQGIELEVWIAYWRLTEAAEAVTAAAALTASARESARLAEGEYSSGITTIVGLIDAQTARTEAERRLVQARLDWYTAKARFEWAVGRSIAEGLGPENAE